MSIDVVVTCASSSKQAENAENVQRLFGQFFVRRFVWIVLIAILYWAYIVLALVRNLTYLFFLFFLFHHLFFFVYSSYFVFNSTVLSFLFR